MNREVFRKNTVFIILFMAVLITIISVISLLTMSIQTFSLIILPLFLAYISLKPKLIIENNMLTLDGLFKTEEISLLDVAQFITDPRTNEVNVVDSMGEHQFKFPISLIADKNRRRFEESIWNVNGKMAYKLASISPEGNRKRIN